MPKTLLVDDNDKFRKALANRLKLRGYEALDVDNGEDAIKHVRADSDIDVVILDRKMPGMMGEQVLKEIKEFRPEVQVIMLTGHATMDSAMETGRLEAYSYLQKPYDFDELVRKSWTLLARTRSMPWLGTRSRTSSGALSGSGCWAPTIPDRGLYYWDWCFFLSLLLLRFRVECCKYFLHRRRGKRTISISAIPPIER